MDIEEFFSRLDAGENDFSGVDLSGAVLSEVDLSGINLSGADLRVTRMEGVNLKMLTYWKLTGTVQKSMGLISTIRLCQMGNF
jgi:uncharacterized protein YjbI with pentapeptide repeats